MAKHDNLVFKMGGWGLFCAYDEETLSAGVSAAMIELVRAGRSPEELAREFEPTNERLLAG
ncbi:MAG TPA: hypothetical protein EYP90_10470 [Chromatiaceae bacterium]|nr:hypothetical protein [Chromatiaceae bacterium]